MKYVMLQDTTGRRYPVIFPDAVCHDDMALFYAEALRASLHPKLALKAVSAGFVNMHVESTNDKSVTLGLDSDPNDAALINVYDYFHGI